VFEYSRLLSRAQKLRSKFLVPRLAGLKRPAHPGPKPRSRSALRDWRKKADAFALFYATLFVPWDSDTFEMKVRTWEDWTKTCQSWQNEDAPWVNQVLLAFCWPTANFEAIVCFTNTNKLDGGRKLE